MRDRALKVPAHELYPNLSNFEGVFLETIFLSAIHRKLALLMLFFVRKDDFPALVRENILSACRTILIRVTFGFA